MASIPRRLDSLMISPALCSQQSMSYSSSKNDQKRCPALQRIQSIQDRPYLSDCNMIVPPKAPAPRNAHNRSGDALSHRMGKKYKGFGALSPENPRLQIRNEPAERVRIPSRPLLSIAWQGVTCQVREGFYVWKCDSDSQGVGSWLLERTGLSSLSNSRD